MTEPEMGDDRSGPPFQLAQVQKNIFVARKTVCYASFAQPARSVIEQEKVRNGAQSGNAISNKHTVFRTTQLEWGATPVVPHLWLSHYLSHPILIF